MKGEIEISGIAVRKGRVQIRFSFYLEPGDARYEEHHVQVPVIPEGGYPGEMDDLGPLDIEDYSKWEESLPKVWQNNPFHNHFEYVDADIADVDLVASLRENMDLFYSIWSKGQDILAVWKSKGALVPGDLSSENIARCELKALDVASRASELSVREI